MYILQEEQANHKSTCIDRKGVREKGKGEGGREEDGGGRERGSGGGRGRGRGGGGIVLSSREENTTCKLTCLLSLTTINSTNRRSVLVC